jgi:hypothetical protein
MTPSSNRLGLILAVGFAVFTLVVIWQVIQNRDHADEGQQAHDAICAFRNDLATRRDLTQKLLNDNPGKQIIDVDPSPLSKLLVSRTVLENSFNGQSATIKSVDRSGIDCKEGT